MSSFLSPSKWASPLILSCLLLSGCSPRLSDAYVGKYQYLRDIRELSGDCEPFRGKEEYFLVVHVDARHLDYSSPEAFFTSMRYGLFLPQEPTIGHAWITLRGKVDGLPWCFEGGHTGEFGLTAPKYFDEVLRRSLETSDPNPAAYLFSSLPDGCLQKGPGGHTPTLSVAFPLSDKEFVELYKLLQRYDFTYWSLQNHQCVHFVLACLKTLGITPLCSQTLCIPREFAWQQQTVRLWEDERYGELDFATPESLEQALFIEVLKKKAFLATKWYNRQKVC